MIFAVFGLTLQLVFEQGVDAFDVAGLRAYRARHPVDRSQFVDDRALDARDRVRLELEPALGIELVDGVDQAENPITDEVALFDALRQSGGDAARDKLHERRVVQDQPLACFLGSVALVSLPQLGDEGGSFVFVVRHEDECLRIRPANDHG
jgi:hypothetical protein